VVVVVRCCWLRHDRHQSSLETSQNAIFWLKIDVLQNMGHLSITLDTSHDPMSSLETDALQNMCANHVGNIGYIPRSHVCHTSQDPVS
jgi:hypothetical protein